MMKICTKCKVNKDDSEFCKKPVAKDGLQPACKACNNQASKIRYRKNWAKVRAKHMAYREQNTERLKAANRVWAAANPDKVAAAQKRYKDTHKSKRNAYLRNRRNADLSFKLVEDMRRKFRLELQGIEHTCSVIQYLGCTVLEARQHLERQWTEGMSWANHERFGWHIDHICPLASFDMSIEEDRCKAWHYSNLQPLWWNDNLSKGASYENSSEEREAA